MDAPDLAQPGTYALLFHCPRAVRSVTIGALGTFSLQRASLLYIGSAFGPGGVGGRLRHHLRPVARPRWHVDYLRPHIALKGVWWAAGARELEHRWAAALTRRPEWSTPVPGLGASDCRCEAHLFATGRRPRGEEVREALAAACAPAALHHAAPAALRQLLQG